MTGCRAGDLRASDPQVQPEGRGRVQRTNRDLVTCPLGADLDRQADPDQRRAACADAQAERRAPALGAHRVAGRGYGENQAIRAGPDVG